MKAGFNGRFKLFYQDYKLFETHACFLYDFWYSIPHFYGDSSSVVEPQIVVLVVAGSNPVYRPNFQGLAMLFARPFLYGISLLYLLKFSRFVLRTNWHNAWRRNKKMKALP